MNIAADGLDGKNMTPRERLFTLSLTCLALLLATGAAELKVESEGAFLESMGIGGLQTVTYRDQTGAEVSFETFIESVERGDSFLQSKDLDTQTAVLTLKSNAPSGPDNEPKVTVGQQVPKISHPDITGTFHDYSDFGGRPVLLSFYFADCVPCIQEIPQLNAFAEEPSETAVIAITFESVEEASAFATKHDFPWPIIADAQSFIEQMGVKIYPTAALVSSEGNLLGMRSGGRVNLDGTNAEPNGLTNWVRELAR